MRSITKIKQNYDLINRKGVISVEYNTKMLGPMKHYAFYDKDKIGQWCDWSYRFTLRWNETELYDRYDKVRSIIKIRQDNDLTNRISVVYVEIENELLWPIE